MLLNTYNEQIHGELARKLESTIFSGNQDLNDSNLKLESLFLDKPIEAQFDHVTGINLRLMGEALFQLSEKEKHLFGVSASTVAMMQHLISTIMDLPRNSMVEVTKKLKHHTPLQILKFVNRNTKELKEVLSAADDFVGYLFDFRSEKSTCRR